MAYFVMLFLVFIGVLVARTQKSYLNFVTVFCFFWTMIVFLANLKLFDMIDYSYKPWVLIIFGTFGMFIGYMIRYYGKIPHINLKKVKKGHNIAESYNDKVIMIIAIVCILFYALELIKVFQLLRTGTSYYFIRRMYQGYEETAFFTSSIERYFSSYIAVPCAYVLSSYIIIMLFRKKKNKIFILSFVAVGLYLVVSASRYILIQLLIGSIYLFAFLKKKLSTGAKKWIKRVALLLIFGVIALTLFRENRTSSGNRYDWTLLQSVYSYFSVSIPLMDYWVTQIDKLGYQAYGLVFCRPILSMFSLICLHPFGIEFDKLNDAIEMINLVEGFVQVFPRHQYNAFASMFYYLYLDFRWVGVFFGSAFWGWICANVFKNARNNPSDRNLAFVLIIMQAMFKTMVRWEFSAPSFFVASILTFFLFGKNIWSEVQKEG